MVKCTPCMFLLYQHWTLKKNNQLQLGTIQSNHNTPKPKTAIEIANNMLGNYIGLTNLHPNNWANDCEVVFISSKVSKAVKNDISFLCVAQKN